MMTQAAHWDTTQLRTLIKHGLQSPLLLSANHCTYIALLLCKL